MEFCIDAKDRSSGGCDTAIARESASQESTGTSDWQEAQKKLRERLQARDDNILEIVRKGEQLLLSEWADFFLENYSKPPMRAPKTHVANLRAVKHLTLGLRPPKLAELSSRWHRRVPSASFAAARSR